MTAATHLPYAEQIIVKANTLYRGDTLLDDAPHRATYTGEVIKIEYLDEKDRIRATIRWDKWEGQSFASLLYTGNVAYKVVPRPENADEE